MKNSERLVNAKHFYNEKENWRRFFFFFFCGFGVIWHSIVAITTKCRKKNTIQKSCDGHNAIEYHKSDIEVYRKS